MTAELVLVVKKFKCIEDVVHSDKRIGKLWEGKKGCQVRDSEDWLAQVQ